MKMQEFIKNNDVIYTKNIVDSKTIKTIEKELGVSFGDELTHYILEYGFLAYKHVEFYGINSKQMLESDMIKQTKYLNKYFPKTIGFIAFENKGDGDYILVSSEDDVYEFLSEDDQVQKTDLQLFDYILKRFNDV